MTPAEAEMHFLENAKKLSMYGVDLGDGSIMKKPELFTLCIGCIPGFNCLHQNMFDLNSYQGCNF